MAEYIIATQNTQETFDILEAHFDDWFIDDENMEVAYINFGNDKVAAEKAMSILPPAN